MKVSSGAVRFHINAISAGKLSATGDHGDSNLIGDDAFERGLIGPNLDGDISFKRRDRRVSG